MLCVIWQKENLAILFWSSKNFFSETVSVCNIQNLKVQESQRHENSLVWCLDYFLCERPKMWLRSSSGNPRGSPEGAVDQQMPLG